jgi:large subunit ribosomal protein L25
MSQQIELSAQLRAGRGKGPARQLRRQGRIPAILYGSRDSSISLSVDQADLLHILKAGSHALIQVSIDGDKKGKHLVMLKDIQNHPISRKIFHIDFLEVSRTQKVVVSIPVVLCGEAIGVKTENGILEHVLRKLDIESPANAIPKNIEIDISALSTGNAIHVEDIVLKENLIVKEDPKQTVVCVVAPKSEEEKAEGEEEMVSEEGETSTGQETN